MQKCVLANACLFVKLAYIVRTKWLEHIVVESVQITFQNSRTLKTEFLELPLNHCAERVNHSKQMLFFVNDQYRVYFVLVQYLFNLCDFGVGANLFGCTCHNVGHGEFEKAVLRVFHGSAYVAIGYDAHHLVVLGGDTKSQSAVTHVNNSLTKFHCWRYDGQVVDVHYIMRFG